MTSTPSKPQPRKILVTLLVVGALLVVNHYFGGDLLGTSAAPSEGTVPAARDTVAANDAAAASGTATLDQGEQRILAAFRDEQSGFMVESAGTVVKILPDDLEGSAHQKFILELPSRHTLLISHNIDLAPRVPLSKGDAVHFYGQYEWSERGGVIHWTHHDPAGRHAGGWIAHQGDTYQ